MQNTAAYSRTPIKTTQSKVSSVSKRSKSSTTTRTFGQVPVSLRSDPSSIEITFDGDYVSANLAKITGNGSATTSQLKNLAARADAQRTYQAMAGAAEVILAGPIVDGFGQLSGKRSAVRSLRYYAEESTFRPIRIRNLVKCRATE